MKNKSGIRIKEIELGSGKQAAADDWVLVEVHFSLNRGDEIDLFHGHSEHRFVVNLRSRDYFPGLRQGIIGMAEGGSRTLRVSPHLAYGSEGIAGLIPPDAVLICKVKLLMIVEKGSYLPDPYHRERQLIISHSGEASRNLPRWHFGIINRGEYGIDVNYPIPGMTWRHTRKRHYAGVYEKDEADLLFEEIRLFPNHSGDHVVKHEGVGVDASEPAGNILRERTTNRLCLSVTYYQENAKPLSYYVREGDPKFEQTRAFRLISTLLAKPELQSDIQNMA